MAEQKEFIYTNKSTYEELQELLDDTAVSSVPLFIGGEYEIVYVDGKPEIVGKTNGVSNPNAQRTTVFDVVHPKTTEAGAWCVNPRYYFRDKEWVDMLPDYNDYTGLFTTDDVSEWVTEL